MQKDTLNQPLDDNTSFIGATSVWPTLGGSANAGSNVIVGDIDTGVWPEHPMLAPGSLGAPAGGLKGCQFGDGTDVAHLGPTFACNNKLIGAYAKTATYMANTGADGQEFCNNTTRRVLAARLRGSRHAHDDDGRGRLRRLGRRCTASSAARCAVSLRARASIEYRVCLAPGCFGSDSVSAVQQAIADGVNVINFSISGGAQPYTDAVELAFLDATQRGDLGQRVGRQQRPGRGDLRSRRTVDDDRGRLDGPALRSPPRCT